ncbi:MAG: hypothetical protein WAS24_09535 [Thermoplasmata archaeon]
MTAITILLVAVEVSAVFVGLRFLRNHKEAMQRVREEEGIDITRPSEGQYYLYASHLTLPIGVSAFFLGFILILVLAMIAYPSHKGEPWSEYEQLLYFTAYLVFGVVLPWLVYVEVSLPRALVTERGIWNLSGINRPFLTEWAEIERVKRSRYPTNERWYLIRGPHGATRIGSGKGMAFFALKLGEKVPKERWAAAADTLVMAAVFGASEIKTAARGGPGSPSQSELREFVEAQQRIEAVGRGIGGAALCVLTSAGIMLWAVIDIAIDPSYGGLGTIEDLASWFCVMSLNVADIFVLIVAWKRMEARYFLLAATLSGFSFAAPLAVLAEVLIWRAHRRHGLPWKKEH